jgi:tetraacyldisaccharide-1-P 4'-kinase
MADQARMHGSNVLLTTEKDAMNMPDSAAEVLERNGVELYWLKIHVHIEKEDQLLELIGSKMRGYSPPPFAGREPRVTEPRP